MQITYLGTSKTTSLKNPIEIELSRKHLLAELARIDILLQRQIQRWQEAGQDPNTTFRGLYISDQEAQALIMRPLNSHWGNTLPGDTTDPYADALKNATLQSHALAEAARHQNHPPRLIRLQETFNLQAFDIDLLLICLAPHLDLRYERIYGYLQDDVTKKHPTINLALDLLCPPGNERLQTLTHFSNQAPLFHHRLLEPLSTDPRTTLLSQILTIDRTIAAWLLGDYQPTTSPSLTLTLHAGETLPGDEILFYGPTLNPEEILEKKPVLAFHGPDLTAQKAAVRQIAQRAKRLWLEIQFKPDPAGDIPPHTALELALRDARLTGAIPFLHGWDTALEDGALPPALFAELCAFPNLLVFSTATLWNPRGYQRERRLHWMEFPIPAYPARLALWHHFLGEKHNTLELDTVAGQFQLTTGKIRDAVASARNIAAQAGRDLTSSDLLTAARSHSNPRLNTLARKLTPHYNWDDIILPDDQRNLLKELVATVRGRPLVLDQWGVGKKLVPSRGVTVLFAGPPGTGKTMSAEIIAAELGLDLFKIDLSTIVSKYIGETEKNLERIFSEAETSNAILFFDEADALFGKRSEVKDSHDRYANIEISYLLQRMEAYDGVTILATNLRANLDEAFTRRLQFAVDFPFPEQADRLRIWQTLFPPDVPHAPDLDFEMLAKRFKLAGGNIRNVIVSAAYLAATNGGTVTMEHLLHGTRRELQKMGRLVSDDELTKTQ